MLLGRIKRIGTAAWTALFLLVFAVDCVSLEHRYIQMNDGYYETMRDNKSQISRLLRRDKALYRVGGMNSAYGSTAEMFLGLQTPVGVGPLILHRYYRFCDRFYHRVARPGWQVLNYGTPGSGRFMDLLNVKYVIDHRTGIIRQRKHPLPRVSLVSGYRVMDEGEILPYLESPSFQPLKEVVFERETAPPDVERT